MLAALTVLVPCILSGMLSNLLSCALLDSIAAQDVGVTGTQPTSLKTSDSPAGRANSVKVGAQHEVTSHRRRSARPVQGSTGALLDPLWRLPELWS